MWWCQSNDWFTMLRFSVRVKIAICMFVSEDESIDFLFETPDVPKKQLDALERTWRYSKKPLLRIGSKGATLTHGNSLRHLLEDHKVVKVKVNTKKFGE